MKTIVCLLFLGLAGPGLLGHSVPAIQATPGLTYEDFARLPQARRDEVFAKFPAETKAAFLKRRFELWLAENRTQLSSRQAAVVQEAIDLVTPEFFQGPPNAKERAQQDAVSKKLRCSLGQELAHSFAKGESAPARGSRTWSQIWGSWTDWVVDCVL